MKRLILMLAMIACMVAAGDVLGQEEVSLENWCQDGLNDWDNLGICVAFRKNNTVEYVELTIEAHERLIVTRHLTVQYGAAVSNQGLILLADEPGAFFGNWGHLDNSGEFRISGTFINGGIFLNRGSLTNLYSVKNEGEFVNQGKFENFSVLVNGELPSKGHGGTGRFTNSFNGTILNVGTIESIYFSYEGHELSAFYNYGAIYNIGAVQGPIYGDNPVIDLGKESYLPLTLVD